MQTMLGMLRHVQPVQWLTNLALACADLPFELIHVNINVEVDICICDAIQRQPGVLKWTFPYVMQFTANQGC